MNDFRFAFRQLLKNPGFTAIVVLTLALGIGANTAVFSVIEAVLLRPLPYPDGDRLLSAYLTVPREADPSGAMPWWSYPKFTVLRDQQQVFGQVAAFAQQPYTLTGTGAAERVETEFVSASYFSVLGVHPLVGRTFLPDEDRTPGTHPVALISHGLWQRHFGGDPQLLGQRIALGKTPLTVVGILPPGFRGQSGSADVWTPMMMAPVLMFPERLTAPFAYWHEVIARLKPGVSLVQASAQMTVVSKALAAALHKASTDFPEDVRLIPLRDANLDPAIKRSLWILFAAVGFLLAIVCVNVANLLLVRSLARQKETAIRLALGATRWRLIRQGLTEGLLLALLGGLFGLVVTTWGVDMLAAIKPSSAPAFRAKEASMLNFSAAHLGGPVLAFNLLLSLGTGLLLSLVPAWHSLRQEIGQNLKAGAGRISGPGSWRHWWSVRSLLTTTEIALSLMLLISAGLMLRTLWNLQATQIGFQAEHVLTARIDLPEERTHDAFLEALLERVTSLPGVVAASLTSSTPLSSNASGTGLRVEGRPLPPNTELPTVGVHVVSPEYFKTLQVPILKGRSFTLGDRSGKGRVAILNATAARQFWAASDPIGKRLQLALGWEEKNAWAEIVGVVGDVKYGRMEEPVEPAVYLSFLQPQEPVSFVMVRTAGAPTALAPALREAVRALDRNLPVYEVQTMNERAATAISNGRFGALLLGLSAVLALILSTVGIYGVMAHSVSQRTREIGIRVALGARRTDVLRLVVWQGMRLALIGVAVGLVGAWGLTRVLAHQLYGVGATDLLTFTLVPLLLGVVSLLASFLPARRAASVDPVVALRCE